MGASPARAAVLCMVTAAAFYIGCLGPVSFAAADTPPTPAAWSVEDPTAEPSDTVDDSSPPQDDECKRPNCPDGRRGRRLRAGKSVTGS